MDYSKENLDELFNYGGKILSVLQDAANDKDKKLENSSRRYENLRDELKGILNKCKD